KIACDNFKYFEEKKYGLAVGNTRLYNPETFIKSDFVEVFFDQKRVEAKKNVYVRIKNTDKKEKDSWDYFELYTSILVYNWENENVFIPKNLTIVSKEIYLDANQLIYNGKTKTMILKGNVKGKGKDQYIQADRVIYNMEKDVMTIEGNVKSVIKVSENNEENQDTKPQKVLKSMSYGEIYDAVLKENEKIVDYFVKEKGFIPTIEIYLNYYTKVEVYKDLFEIKVKNSIYDIDKSKFVFLPFMYRELKLDKGKYIAWYVDLMENVFFENYQESINFIKSNIYSENCVLFTSPKGLNIAVFENEDKKKWYQHLFDSTINENFIKGYWFSFEDLEFFNIFKNNPNEKEAFFIIDDIFWKNFNQNRNIVFNNYPFKVNLLVKVDDVKKINYNANEFYKFLFWKSFLYDCTLYVDQDIYDLKSNYFKIIRI
ncbi:MAG: LptA/OstA family protein, partial [bacterium]